MRVAQVELISGRVSVSPYNRLERDAVVREGRVDGVYGDYNATLHRVADLVRAVRRF